MLCFATVSNLKLRKNYKKKSERFSKKSIYNMTDCDNPSNHRWCSCKKYRGNIIVFIFLQGIWLHPQREDGKTTSSELFFLQMMILYKNTKAMARSPDRDTDFLNIVAGVLKGDTFALYLFIINVYYKLWTSIYQIKENSFTLKKGGHEAEDIMQKL